MRRALVSSTSRTPARCAPKVLGCETRWDKAGRMRDTFPRGIIRGLIEAPATCRPTPGGRPDATTSSWSSACVSTRMSTNGRCRGAGDSDWQLPRSKVLIRDIAGIQWDPIPVRATPDGEGDSIGPRRDPIRGPPSARRTRLLTQRTIRTAELGPRDDPRHTGCHLAPDASRLLGTPPAPAEITINKGENGSDPTPPPVRALKSLGIRDYARHCETDVGQVGSATAAPADVRGPAKARTIGAREDVPPGFSRRQGAESPRRRRFHELLVAEG